MIHLQIIIKNNIILGIIIILCKKPSNNKYFYRQQILIELTLTVVARTVKVSLIIKDTTDYLKIETAISIDFNQNH